MKKHNLVISLIIILLIILSSTVAYTQDWPQFMGIGRDSKVDGFKAPSTWPAELSRQWQVSVGAGDATPLLVKGKIYLHTRQGNEEVVLCRDATTGKEIWRTSYSAPAVTGPSSSHPGPRSTPALANGKIVTFGVSGILTCLDAASGKVLWNKPNPTNAVPQYFTGMSPLIVDNICIAHVGSKDNGEVLALDMNTGNEKWKWTGDVPAYASPSIMTMDGRKQVIVLTEKNLIGLDLSNGSLLWQIPTPAQQRFYICSSPYINRNIIYYTGLGTGTRAIQVQKQAEKYITRELWSNPEVGAKWNTPILKDGFLYGFTDQRRIYCLNASTGQTAWIDNAVNSDFATIIDCGSVIIGFPSTGNLIVFKPDPKLYSEVAKYKVTDTPVYAFPIVAGNLIYVKDAESLILYKIN